MSNFSDRLRRLPRNVARLSRERWRTAERPRAAVRRFALALRAAPSRAAARRRESALRNAQADLGPAAGPPTTVVRLDQSTAAANRAVLAATTELVTLTLATTEPLATDCDARLAATIAGTVAIAGPLVVHPVRPLRAGTPRDATVRSRGIALTVRDDAPSAVALGAGTIPEPEGDPVPVPTVAGAHAVVQRAALVAVGGIPDITDPDVTLIEIARRLAVTGHTVAVVPHAVVCDHRPIAAAADPDAPFDPTGAAWRGLLADHGAALRRWAGDTNPTSFAITVAAPSARVAERWGDWHLAHDLAAALTVAGHPTRVGALDRADAPATRSADVHLVVRGLAPVVRTRGQVHVLWIISHPTTVTAEECDAADLVLVASPRFAEHLRTRTRTPVEVILQATDARRFAPRLPDPRFAHDVLVVAKSRGVHRRMVADAVAAGLQPAIYGSGWRGIVDRDLVVAERVANAELPTVYSSARVLLNDHWDDMREWGFLSNRLFDALACGTPVVSDRVPGLTDVFGNTILVADDAASLRTAVDAVLADPVAARARAARGGELVRAAHTFDHRAREILAALARHGIETEPDRGPRL